MLESIDYKLNSLLVRNEVTSEQFMYVAYNCMLVSIFEIIVDRFINDEYRKSVKRRLLNSSNKILTIQKIVYELTKCKLSTDECEIIYKYICAYFTKNNKRNNYDDNVKQELLKKQNFCCNICKTNIENHNSELDHIVPWIYVGDEMGIENLQMLCKDCNRRKGKSSSYNFQMFLISK